MSKRAIIFGGLGLAAIVTAALFLLDPDPQAVLRKAQRKIVTEDAMRVDLEGRVVQPPGDPAGVIVAAATGVDIVMRTDLDFSVPLDQSSRTTFAFSQQTAEGEPVVLSGESRRKAGRHYLRLERTGGLTDDLAERLRERWVVSGRSFLDFLLPPDERALEERPLDIAGLTTMAIAFTDVDLFRVTEKLPDAKVGDVKARHYAVELNMDAVSALMLKLREVKTGVPIQADDVLVVTAEVVRWGQPVGEVWIDKRHGKFLKVELVSALDGDVASGAIGGMMTFSRYGEPVSVEAPQAEELERVLGPNFAKRLSLADDRAAQAAAEAAADAPKAPTALPAPGEAVMQTDSDADGLSDGQEFFYGSDAWNPDTDADGWTDGLEVSKGMDPVGPGALFGFGL